MLPGRLLMWPVGDDIPYGYLTIVLLSIYLIAGSRSIGKLYKKIKYAGSGL